MKLFLILSIFLLGMTVPYAGDVRVTYPKNDFRSPIDSRILLSGSFAEVRKNHLHSGIDIRTEGGEGKPIYAIADGFVARVFVSPTGFGKALYLQHPNGYTSVYGHLQRFNGAIATWVRNQQYKKESFELDAPVDAGLLKVKKGDIIAYSGNSGSSGGPHLHFEIRDTPTQETINPGLFGIQIADDLPPVINSIRVYPADETGRVNGERKEAGFAVTGSAGRYNLKNQERITLSGNIFFGIQAWDFINDNNLKTGITSVELRIDTTVVFSQDISRFAFSATRYVNSIIDYSHYVRDKQTILRSYVAANNKFPVFRGTRNRGVVNFTDAKDHRLTYTVKDAAGNASRFTFTVISLPSKKTDSPRGAHGENRFTCSSSNSFKNGDLTLTVPGEALYEDLDFRYSEDPPVAGSFSPVYHLQDEETPLHTYCTLAIKPLRLPQQLASKALVVKVVDDRKFSSRGGKWEDGVLKAQIREFGDFTVVIDTTPPVIRPVNIAAGKKIAGSVQVKISDNLSGIKSYRGTLDGRWILMDYDAKNNLLRYSVDDRMKPGKNEFRLVVRDDVGNESVYRATLIR